jgi:hypothetical protein
VHFPGRTVRGSAEARSRRRRHLSNRQTKNPDAHLLARPTSRVAVLEDYLLEHALYSLGIPNAPLIFPGEDHSLSTNPWHGKIKVRDELKWLQK